MDTTELLPKLTQALTVMLTLGDRLDEMGTGAYTITTGEVTTRQVVRMDLGYFLAYLADGNGTYSEGEITIINYVMGPPYKFSELELKNLVSDIGCPNPNEFMSLQTFLASELVSETVYKETSFDFNVATDNLINLFESFGTLLVALDDNAVSRERLEQRIEAMKDTVKLARFGTKDRTEGISTAKFSSTTTKQKSTSKKSTTSKTTTKSVAKTSNDSATVTRTNESKSDWEIDNFGNLTRYHGTDTAVVIPHGIKTIGSLAFLRSKDITQVVIPEGCREIGANCFFKCKSLNSVTLPSTIVKIGECAFEHTALTSIIIPEGCREIGEYCFAGCESLNNVTLPMTIEKIGVLAFKGTDITSIVIPEGCREIGEYCFAECESLTNVTLPMTIEKIGYFAFKGTDITSIIIPEGCVEIGEGSFSDCFNLKHVYVPSSVSYIGEDAFNSNNDTVIHTVKGSTAETFAKEHNLEIKFDYKSTSTGTTSTKKSTTEKVASADNTASTPVQHSSSSTLTQKTTTAPAKKEGCYIATAVYGSYDAPQVITLRSFRDKTLMNSVLGRLFIRTYYRLSPSVAEKLKNAKHINKFVRYILEIWVKKLHHKKS